MNDIEKMHSKTEGYLQDTGQWCCPVQSVQSLSCRSLVLSFGENSLSARGGKPGIV